jgi:hypothetical protein
MFRISRHRSDPWPPPRNQEICTAGLTNVLQCVKLYALQKQAPTTHTRTQQMETDMPVSLLTNFVRASIKETAGAIDDVLDAVSGLESDARDFVCDTRKTATEHLTSSKDTLRDLAASTRQEASDFVDAIRDEGSDYAVEVRDDAKDLATDARETTLKVAGDVRSRASGSIRDGLERIRKETDRLQKPEPTEPKKVAKSTKK